MNNTCIKHFLIFSVPPPMKQNHQTKRVYLSPAAIKFSKSDSWLWKAQLMVKWEGT